MADQEKSAFDAFESLRSLRDSYLDSMAKSMVEAVNTESYAQATGAMLESYLNAVAPFREALEKSMTETLRQMSLPSRQEVAALAERFTNIEMRLDDMDAKLDSIARKMAGRDGGAPPEGGDKDRTAKNAPAETAAASPAHGKLPGVPRNRGARKAQR